MIEHSDEEHVEFSFWSIFLKFGEDIFGEPLQVRT